MPSAVVSITLSHYRLWLLVPMVHIGRIATLIAQQT